jgi:hypothetical protein
VSLITDEILAWILIILGLRMWDGWLGWWVWKGFGLGNPANCYLLLGVGYRFEMPWENPGSDKTLY